MSEIHLWVEGIIEVDGAVVRGATLEGPGEERLRLWYRLPAEHRPLLTESGDPFVVAALFQAMQRARTMVVHGEVSPSLLRNLEEFQAAWSSWRPQRYRRVEIVADVEREQGGKHNDGSAVVAFSGGVDSAFTAFRHRTGRVGRHGYPLQAGLMVHGFDIPLEEEEVFRRAAEKSARMLESLGMTLIPMATNFREMAGNWDDLHGAAIASCLMLLQGGYRFGLIASTEPYSHLVLPWGSNPVTDGLLSSEGFRIVHDGAGFTRGEKIRVIADWPEALRYLRVCWEGAEKDRNCGRCEKCIRTILNFRVAGLGLPDCFERDVTDEQILSLPGLKVGSVSFLEMERILRQAKAAGLSDSWVNALEQRLQRSRQAAKRRRGLWRRLKRTRGIRRVRRLLRRTV